MPHLIHYYNLQPWEEKSIPNPNGHKMVIDNQDTHSANWDKLITLLDSGHTKVVLRSLVDICPKTLHRFLTWMKAHPIASSGISGIQGESLAVLISNHAADARRLGLQQLKHTKSLGTKRIGRPPTVASVSQITVLCALRDRRSVSSVARHLGMCTASVYNVAKGKVGIRGDPHEIEALGLTKWIPNKENPRQPRKAKLR